MRWRRGRIFTSPLRHDLELIRWQWTLQLRGLKLVVATLQPVSHGPKKKPLDHECNRLRDGLVAGSYS